MTSIIKRITCFFFGHIPFSSRDHNINQSKMFISNVQAHALVFKTGTDEFDITPCIRCGALFSRIIGNLSIRQSIQELVFTGNAKKIKKLLKDDLELEDKVCNSICDAMENGLFSEALKCMQHISQEKAYHMKAYLIGKVINSDNIEVIEKLILLNDDGIDVTSDITKEDLKRIVPRLSERAQEAVYSSLVKSELGCDNLSYITDTATTFSIPYHTGATTTGTINHSLFFKS